MNRISPRTPPVRRRRAAHVFVMPEHHTAEIAGGIAALLAIPTLLTDGVWHIVLLVVAFVAVAVAGLAVAGELRARRREWCRGEIITDSHGRAMSASADIGVIAAGHTPSRHGRSRVGAGIR